MLSTPNAIDATIEGLTIFFFGLLYHTWPQKTIERIHN